MSESYVVGIDLGTTHCVLAEGAPGRRSVRVMDIPQVVVPGEVAARPLLPSFLYLPAPGELSPDALALPWGGGGHAVGEVARRLGSKVPDRLVASAKSWICHGGVNRRASILPWSAPDSEPHVSPYEAQLRYLEHLRQAWEAAHPGLRLSDQDVVVTVPASFDAAARELTLDAARGAELGEVRLIEEPQAAFYDFLAAFDGEGELAERLGEARLILVVDVGGGTTDLTLLRVTPSPAESDNEPDIERIAVGGHLMLGGDNMDATLAHHVLEQAGIDTRLDPTEWAALIQSTRDAKELLLGAGAPETTVVSVQRRGARLISGTRSVTLRREDIARVILDGFVPLTGPDEVAGRAARAGLTTLGLPYATDPAIPRHVNAFLRRHRDAAVAAGARVHGDLPRPDLLLLNGGVFNAPAVAERLCAALAGWYGGEAIPTLEHTSLDQAVARGAALYAWARRGRGRLISGGAARAYYLGVDGPGGERRALCVAPRGMDEGSSVDVPGRTFELVLDRPVVFPLYGYSGDRTDAPGAVVDVDQDLDVLPALETVLRSRGEGAPVVTREAGTVPVTPSATLTDRGALELYLTTLQLPPRRWRLELSLGAPQGEEPRGEEPRGEEDAPSDADASEEPLPARFGDALAQLRKALGGSPADVKELRRSLEELLGSRGEWSAATCRALADALLAKRADRRSGAEHELTWLRLLGWCLRPGWGYRGDGERMAAVWSVHEEGLAHPNKLNAAEWWILWRRVGPGLGARQQQQLFAEVERQGHAKVEMLQLVASLERLTPAQKERAGAWTLERIHKLKSWWALGRLGARELLHGDPADVVRPAVAEEWLRQLLALDWERADGAAFAAALIARATGDARRDLDPAVRREVAGRLRAADAPPHWVTMMDHAVALSRGDAGRMAGDALPAGLRLT